MASTNKTEHYGLNLWEGEDHFLRADFNADNGRIDAAIHAARSAAERAAADLVPVSYHVYNLMLQNYYEGKETGYKKALAFDGFLDGALVESVSDGVAVAGDRAFLGLGSGATPVDVTREGTNDNYIFNEINCAEEVVRVEGCGLLASADYGFRPGVPGGYYVATVRLYAYNAATKQRGALLHSKDCPVTLVEGNVRNTLTLNFPVQTGDYYLTCMPKVDTPGTVISLYSALKLHYSPVSKASGTMTAKPQAIPGGFRGGRAYLRYTGGTVGLAVKDSGGAYREAVLTGTSAATDLRGYACTEGAFALPQLDASVDALTLRLTLAGDGTRVFDYGLILQ